MVSCPLKRRSFRIFGCPQETTDGFVWLMVVIDKNQLSRDFQRQVPRTPGALHGGRAQVTSCALLQLHYSMPKFEAFSYFDCSILPTF